MTETVFIGFGSNLGHREDYCDRAVTLMGLLPFSKLVAVSSLYETEPVRGRTDPGAGWFLNGVVRIATDLRPGRLLEICREVEQTLGRDQDHRGGPRTLDLDLLFYGTRILREPGLVIPHPRLHQRRFVLAPMAELAPDWVHPVSGRSMKELLDQLEDTAQVRRLAALPHPR